MKEGNEDKNIFKNVLYKTSRFVLFLFLLVLVLFFSLLTKAEAPNVEAAGSNINFIIDSTPPPPSTYNASSSRPSESDDPEETTPPSNIIIIDNKTSGELILKWDNPEDNNFDYTNIYRSEEEGVLGNLIEENIKSEDIMDTGLDNGIQYFYTLRSVSKDNIETQNINQYEAMPSYEGENEAIKGIIKEKDPYCINTKDKKCIVCIPDKSTKEDYIIVKILKKDKGSFSSNNYNIINVFDVFAWNPNTNLRVERFEDNIQITLQYQDDEIKNLEEESVKLFYLDEEKNQWIEMTNTLYDYTNNIMTLSINHLSIYALMGMEKESEKNPQIIPSKTISNPNEQKINPISNDSIGDIAEEPIIIKSATNEDVKEKIRSERITAKAYVPTYQESEKMNVYEILKINSLIIALVLIAYLLIINLRRIKNGLWLVICYLARKGQTARSTS